jgi:hypothetical protein
MEEKQFTKEKSEISEKEKLCIALQQVENLISLLKGNQYEKYLTFKLTSVYYEIQRQISLHS